MNKRIAILIALWCQLVVLTGCGTIAGSDQVISIDSLPRGAKVKALIDDEWQNVGETPMFLRVERDSQISLQLSNASTSKPYTIDCGLRYPESIIPHSAIALAGLWALHPVGLIGPLFQGVDWLDGNMYACPLNNRIVMGSAQAKDFAVQEQQRWLLTPVPVPESDVSARLGQQWLKQVNDVMGSKVSVSAADEQFYRLLHYYNLDRTDNLRYSSLDAERWAEIGLRTKATHVVFWTKPDEKTGARSPKVYDLHTSNRIVVPESLTLHVSKEENEKGALYNNAVNFFSNLIPNAITYTYADAIEGISVARSGYEITNEKEMLTVPRLLANLGLLNIDHPNGFRTWDYKFRIAPVLFARHREWRYRMKLEDQYNSGNEAVDGPHKFDYKLTYTFLFTMAGLGLDLHTPLGRIGASYLGGGVFSRVKDSNGSRSSVRTFAHGYRAEYSAFLSDQIFFIASMQWLYMRKSLIDTQFTQDLKTFIHWSGGLGYFLP